MNFKPIATAIAALSVSLAAQPAPLVTAESEPAIVANGPDYLVWQQTATAASEGTPAQSTTRSWTELATGLTYFDEAAGAWLPTVEAFEIAPDGSAVALRGPHHLVLAPNLHTQGAIDLETPDGSRFRSHLLGLAYTDPLSGKSVLIAEPQDCVGTLVAPNRVVWEDAFTDLKASVRVTYTKAGMEHDVVLRSAPPPPSAFGLPESSLLEVWHELVDVPWQEAPLKSSATNGPSPNAKIVFEKDQSLMLGSMTMGQGRAFSLGTDSPEVDLPAL